MALGGSPSPKKRVGGKDNKESKKKRKTLAATDNSVMAAVEDVETVNDDVEVAETTFDTPVKSVGLKKKKDKDSEMINDNDDENEKVAALREMPTGPRIKFSENVERLAETIYNHQWVKGSLVMGTISEVKRDGLRVHLPCGHVAQVAKEHCTEIPEILSPDGMAEAPSALEKRFRRGQHIVAAVVSNVQGSMIQLTVRPSIVNAGLDLDSLAPNMWLPCSVRSVEDHGFVGTLGIDHKGSSNVTVFVKLSSEREETANSSSPTKHITALSRTKETHANYSHYLKPWWQNLRRGQIMNVCVDDVNRQSRVVSCSANANAASACLPFDKPVDVKLIKAGMLVECYVSRLFESEDAPAGDIRRKDRMPPRGAAVKFCRSVEGAIPRTHLYHPAAIPSDTIMEEDSKFCFPKFSFEDKYKARVVAVMPAALSQTSGGGGFLGGVSIYLSMLPHVVGWGPMRLLSANCTPKKLIGLRLPKARIIDRLGEHAIRLIAAIPVGDVAKDVSHEVKVEGDEDDERDVNNDEYHDDDDSGRAFEYITCVCRKQQALDDPALKLAEVFEIGSKCKARILNLHSFDGIANVSLKKTTYEEKLFSETDVKPGQIVEGSISRKPWGVLVRLSDSLLGRIHTQHLTDNPLGHVHPSFKNGLRGTFRILTSSLEYGIVLTAKKTLVEIKDPILTIADATPGRIAMGFVSQTDKSGYWVEFFGKVMARVSTPGSRLSGRDGEMKRGQLVEVKILSQNIQTGTIRATANLTEQIDEPDSDDDDSDVEMTDEKTEAARVDAMAKEVKKEDLEEDVKMEEGVVSGHGQKAVDTLTKATAGRESPLDAANATKVLTKAASLCLDDVDSSKLLSRFGDETKKAGAITDGARPVATCEDGVFVVFTTRQDAKFAKKSKKVAPCKELQLGFVPTSHLADDHKQGASLKDVIANVVSHGSTKKNAKNKKVNNASDELQLPSLPPMIVLHAGLKLKKVVGSMKGAASTLSLPVLSAKCSLLDSASRGTFVASKASLEKAVQTVCLGYVTRVEANKVFVSLGDWQCSGSVARKSAADHVMDDSLTNVFTEGQTVKARVLSVTDADDKSDHDKPYPSFLLSLLPSAVESDIRSTPTTLSTDVNIILSRLRLSAFLGANSLLADQVPIQAVPSPWLDTQATQTVSMTGDVLQGVYASDAALSAALTPDTKLAVASLCPGSVVECSVMDLTNFGLLLKVSGVATMAAKKKKAAGGVQITPLPSDPKLAICGVVLKKNLPKDSAVTKGDVVRGVLLELDWESKIADITLKVDLVERQTNSLTLLATCGAPQSVQCHTSGKEISVNVDSAKWSAEVDITARDALATVNRQLLRSVASTHSDSPILAVAELNKPLHSVISVPLDISFAAGDSATLSIIVAGTPQSVNSTRPQQPRGAAKVEIQLINTALVDFGAKASSLKSKDATVSSAWLGSRLFPVQWVADSLWSRDVAPAGDGIQSLRAKRPTSEGIQDKDVSFDDKPEALSAINDPETEIKVSTTTSPAKKQKVAKNKNKKQ